MRIFQYKPKTGRTWAKIQNGRQQAKKPKKGLTTGPSADDKS
jgi:hypothetical protein